MGTILFRIHVVLALQVVSLANSRLTVSAVNLATIFTKKMIVKYMETAELAQLTA